MYVSADRTLSQLVILEKVICTKLKGLSSGGMLCAPGNQLEQFHDICKIKLLITISHMRVMYICAWYYYLIKRFRLEDVKSYYMLLIRQKF